jgi:hypothetical protein
VPSHPRPRPCCRCRALTRTELSAENARPFTMLLMVSAASSLPCPSACPRCG